MSESPEVDAALAVLAAGATELDASRKGLEQTDVSRLLRALALSTSVTAVNLSGAVRRIRRCGPARARCGRGALLSRAWRRGWAPTDNTIGVAGAAALAEVLKENSKIVTVAVGSKWHA